MPEGNLPSLQALVGAACGLDSANYSLGKHERLNMEQAEPQRTKGTAKLSRLGKLIVAGVAAVCLGGGIQSAMAQGGVAAGLLTCAVKGGASFIIGSTRELRCIFRVNPNDPGFRYGGKIQKFGLD